MNQIKDCQKNIFTRKIKREIKNGFNKKEIMEDFYSSMENYVLVNSEQ